MNKKIAKIIELANELKSFDWNTKPKWTDLVSLASKLLKDEKEYKRIFNEEEEEEGFSEWTNIELNSNSIHYSTGRAYLIKIPKSQWAFWIPAKLVRFFGKNDYKISVGLNRNMTFNMKKINTKSVKDTWDFSELVNAI